MSESAGLQVQLSARVGRLELEVEFDTAGGTLVLIGPNGAGKTSLLSLVLGVRKADTGSIRLGATVLLDTQRGIDVPVEHRRLAYVPQDYALFPHLSVRGNLEFALASTVATATPATRAQRIDALLHELDLTQHQHRRPQTLSGGEKQRVALARALSVQPHALLLDEPLAALDVHSRQAVREFLGTYLQQLRLPTIVVTHDAADARVLGDRIAVLESGRITQTGTWSELARHQATPFVAEFMRTTPSATLAQDQ